MHPAPSAAVLAELRSAVGDGGWLAEPADVAPYLVDHRRLYQGATPLVLRPRSTPQVSDILRICARAAVAVVPHGGNTGYCGGATPDESGSQVVLSLQRLNRVRRVDAADYSMIVEAGVTLAEAQRAAREAGRLFPLSIGSEGTAQIGGNLSTNAGGTAVLRYGMMRDLVLGLEVVLADGRQIAGLKSLRKDNTGYDVKSLFIGAEGTLGIITAAALKLFPDPKDSATALVGIEAPARAIELLARLRSSGGDQLTTFELMPRYAVALTVKHVPGVANPLEMQAPWYLLVELTSPNVAQQLATTLGNELQSAAEHGTLLDAMLASSLSQAEAMWKLRESIPEAQRKHGPSLKHDVSVPVSAIPTLIERGTVLMESLAPDGEVVSYGHVGDGNLHFNVSLKSGGDAARFAAGAHALEHAMFDLVESLGGSISAEHGIGRLKAHELAARADPVELAVMHALKRALDPQGILNPGKVLWRELNVPLGTSRLCLRDFRAEDFDAVLAYSADPRVTKYLFFGPRDEMSTREYLEELLASQRERPRTRFELAVEETATGRVIGACDLSLVEHNVMDLGYMLEMPSWGKGFATEIAGHLLEAAFQQLRVDQVISTVDVNNRASIRVLEKVGMRWEAIYRRHRRAKNRWWDCHLFVMPRAVWEAARTTPA